MTKIIPIKDLRDTNKISSMCNKVNEPIFVTKNGYNDLVIMSDKCYENLIFSRKSLQNSTIFYNSAFKTVKQSDTYGFIKVAAISLKTKIGDVVKNTEEIKNALIKIDAENVDAVVFNELTLTGYTLNDAFFDETISKNVIDALIDLKEFSKNINSIFIVGAPLRLNSKNYNCACVFYNGSILGIVPKTYLPNYHEFYEMRHFEAADEENYYYSLKGEKIPFSKNIIFKDLNYLDFTFGIEICEDLWASNPPSNNLCQNGANIIFNLSASNETIYKEKTRENLVSITSKRNICGYVYSSSGLGESSTDLIFSGQTMIAENGLFLEKSAPFSNKILISDIDLSLIKIERTINTSYKKDESKMQYIYFEKEIINKNLHRVYSKNPFLPEENKSYYLNKVIKMQGISLMQRLKSINCNKVALAFSGGLDSTMALIAAYEAFKTNNLPLENIHVLTLPSFGTSKLTHENAIKLSTLLHVTFKEINIKDSILQHFKDIGHDENNVNVTYENSQARERTLILLDYCNDINALMIGTGDLSELCLGFTTFGGDHLSNYGLNASLPKTLIQEVLKNYSDEHENLREVLISIIETPISPELLPQDNNKNEFVQKTEDVVGPYILNDFFLYYYLKYKMSFKKIFYIANHTFKDTYSSEFILKTLKTFVKKFFSNQFKRSCLPDGPKISEISISPRGDLRLPSDIDYKIYLKELDDIRI